MNKINGLVLSALTAAFLVGCGGGGSGGTTAGTTVETPTEAGVTSITYDRGPVYGAVVTDKNGKQAIDNGTNVYKFVGTFEYPITAKGGKVDTDGDGLVDETLPETFEYKSNYEVITPITNYLSAFSGDELTAKLEKLELITGLTKDEMKFKVSKDITDATKLKSFDGLKNTLFKAAIDSDTENDDITSDVFANIFNFTKEKTEKEVFNELRADTSAKFSFTEISQVEAEKIKEELGTASDKLKIADLGRFVSYEGAEDWYDENTLSGDKLTFKPYSYKRTTASTSGEWVLDEGDGYVTVTKDATNPYKFSYVDSITKEEGTFTIISTTKLGNYTDLSKSIAKIEVTKAATELEWNRWPSINPTYFDKITQTELPITNVDELYVRFSDVTNAIVTKEADRVVYTSKDGKEHSYYKLVQENGNYYIESSDLNDVGYIDNEIIYTGSSLDDLIANIKAEAPVFTSWGNTYADENQTSAYTPTITSDSKVTYSLSGTEAKYFNIDSVTGVVTFKTAPDYETKLAYSFYIIAKNSVGKSSSQLVNIKINNLEESTTPTTDATTFSKSDLIGKKLVVSNETFFFEQDRVVLGDSGADYTTILSYTSVESNKIVLSNGDILEKTVEGYKITFEFGTAQQETSTGLQLSVFVMDELESALSDVASTPTIPTTPVVSQTDSVVYGKRLYFGNGQSTARFFTDGSYQEDGLNQNPSTGNFESYNCSGLWKDLGNNKIGVTCQDNGTSEIPDGIVDLNSNEIIFTFKSSNPKSGDSFDITDADGTYTDRIDGLSSLPL